MTDATMDKLVWAIKRLKKTAKQNDLSLDDAASIVLGLDDVRHNRLYTYDLKTGKSKRVPGYGKPKSLPKNLRRPR